MMTQKDKELLLKDICGRIPYRLKVKRNHDGIIGTLYSVSCGTLCKFLIVWDSKHGHLNVCDDGIDEFKPYLRPMSSMTEEEEGMYNLLQGISHLAEQHWTAKDGKVYRYADAIDWLNEHHFDYRGLIPMGLAMEAKEGMYKTE